MRLISHILIWLCILLLPSRLVLAQIEQEAAVDLRAAARERAQFRVEAAGPEAARHYQLFLDYWARGQEEAARREYLIAHRHRETYIQAEIDRFESIYQSALEAFERGNYDKAEQHLKMLYDLMPGQIGYDEVYLKYGITIREYLAQISLKRRTVRLNRIQHARVAFWVHSGYYFTSNTVGLKATLLPPPPVSAGVSNTFKLQGLPAMSFVGYDLAVAYRASSSVWAGLGWSTVLHATRVKFQARIDGELPVRNGKFQTFSAFVQHKLPSPAVLPVYGQGGLTVNRVDFSRAVIELLNPWYSSVLGGGGRDAANGYFGDRVVGLLPGHRETDLGFFLGVSTDFIPYLIGEFPLGIRFDIKYHVVLTQEEPVTNQKLALNGLRIGLGIVILR